MYETEQCLKCMEDVKAQALSTLKVREKLLLTVNKAAEILLTANDDETLAALMAAMEVIGHCVDADRVQIWRNEMINNELHFVMRYEWLSEIGKQKKEVPIGLKFPYSELPDWYENFMNKVAINSPIKFLQPRDEAFLGYYEMVSIVCLPLFLHGEFIGFFSVDDCRVEKSYSDDEMEMFYTVGNMFANVFNQVTKKQALEEAERASSNMAFIQKMIDNAPVFIELWDEKGTLLDCNRKMLDALGVKNKEDFAQNFFNFSMPIQPCGLSAMELNEKMIAKAKEKGKSRNEWVFKLPNGDTLPTETTWVHFTHQSNSFIVVYSLDSRPIKAAIESDESNKAKSRFLARMSHEIRTPISAVMGISEIQLRNQEMPPHTEDAFSKIYDSSKMLLNIVNDILDFSKVESGKMYIVNSEYETASIVSDVAQLQMVYADQKDVQFDMYIDENIPVKLEGDVLRIKQIIANLLTNAFKYTEKGNVTLILKRVTSTDGQILLEISVKDTGIGMTAIQINELQEEYVRLHEHEKPFVSGTGLGIPIVRSLVRIMDADFELSSEPNIGTRAVVRIPQKIANDDIIGYELAKNLQDFNFKIWTMENDLDFVPTQMPHGKVLVVDDIEMNLFVAEAMLESFGLTVELSASGDEVIEKIKNGSEYDVIFLDYMMPGKDGIETVEVLRKLGYKHPIVALTANAIKGQSELFIRSGFSGFMTKPIDIKMLGTYLEKFIGG